MQPMDKTRVKEAIKVTGQLRANADKLVKDSPSYSRQEYKLMSSSQEQVFILQYAFTGMLYPFTHIKQVNNYSVATICGSAWLKFIGFTICKRCDNYDVMG